MLPPATSSGAWWVSDVEERFGKIDRLDPGDPEMVAFWAAKWGVKPRVIYNAIRKVGPLVRDVTVEIWSQI